MFKENNLSIATRLQCAPKPIPVEFEGKATHLASTYVKYSLSGLYAMDYDIVYNRVCNLIHNQLSSNPVFCVDNFSNFIDERNLFYGFEGIQTLLSCYKENPEITFPYIICFFTRKLNSFKRTRVAYIKNIDAEDVDEVMMIAIFKALERYTSGSPFSFEYLDLELFSAITQLGGELHTFGLSRNDYVNYLKLAFFIDKHSLTPDNLELFLFEINNPEKATHFTFDEQDLKYGCKITLRKAYDYYKLYTIESLGIISDTTYDDANDMIIDNTGASIENGYEEAELNLYATQTFPCQNEQLVFRHLTEPNGAVFTNHELLVEYNYTRYGLGKMKNQIRKDFS